MNSMSLSQPSAFADRSLNLNILIRETLEGDLIARVLEFPEWMVQAANRQEAIEKIRKLVNYQLTHEEIIPLTVNLPPLKSSVHKFAGMFEDDPDFEMIHHHIIAERTSAPSQEPFYKL